jgi:hypothetical protein
VHFGGLLGRLSVNDFGEQGLTNTCFSNDDERLSGGGELRDSRLEFGDGRAVAYDLQRVQGSDPDERGERGLTSGVASRNGVSCAEWSLDSEGLWTRKDLLRKDQTIAECGLQIVDC